MIRHWDRVFRSFGVFVTAVFLLVALTPLSNFISQRYAVTEDRQASEAIVVLGAGILRGGTLLDESLRRAMCGIELYKTGFAPLIVFSGPGRSDAPMPTEADVRSSLAVKMGIPSEAILKEETAKSTQEESTHISRLLKTRNIHKILLVTESIHMRRGQLLFQHEDMEVFTAASDNYPAVLFSAQDRVWLVMRSLQETMALIYYRLAGYV